MYGPDKRGSALGILQAANAVGFVMGPVFAGWLLDAYDWTAIFWARIPFAILAILLAFLALGFKHPFRFSERQQTYDYLGAVYLTLSLYGILYGCNKLPVEDNHLDPLVWIIFTLGFVLFYLFIKQERKHPDPLIDLSLFTKSNDFTKASIAFASVFASFPVYLFILPIIMINGLEMKAWDAGLALGLAALATLIISPIAGNLSDRAGPEKLCMSGAILTGVGYMLLFLVNADSTVLSILPAMALIGAGTGLFFSPNNNLMMASAPPERAGMVSGLFGVLRQSGYALGFAVTASLFTAIQNWFDLQWAYSSVKLGSLQSADSITDIYHQGSQWSPETLVFILHIGVLLCSSILIITLVNSIPKIRLQASRQISVILASVIVAVLTMGSYSLTAPGTIDSSEDQSIIKASTPNVLAFGMASRKYDLVEEANPVHIEAMDNFKPDDISNQAYLMRCGVCHGSDLEGTGLGVTLTESLFLQNMDIKQTIEFLNAGRMPNSEDSISGGVMPSFSWLPESELEEIATFIKSQKISK